MDKEKEWWDQMDAISRRKAEDKRIRGKLLEDLNTKNNMVRGFEIERKIAQETKKELEKVKRELEEEKQRRGNEVTALEQENTSEIMAGALKDQQIATLQRNLGATREELTRVRSSNEQNKEKLKGAETRKNMYKEEKETLAKEKEEIERSMNRMKEEKERNTSRMIEEEREMRRQLEQQIGYWEERNAGQIERMTEQELIVEDLEKKIRESKEEANNYLEDSCRLQGIINKKNKETEKITAKLQGMEESMGTCNEIVENMKRNNEEMKERIRELESRNAELMRM